MVIRKYLTNNSSLCIEIKISPFFSVHSVTFWAVYFLYINIRLMFFLKRSDLITWRIIFCPNLMPQFNWFSVYYSKHSTKSTKTHPRWPPHRFTILRARICKRLRVAHNSLIASLSSVLVSIVSECSETPSGSKFRKNWSPIWCVKTQRSEKRD